MSRTYKHIPRNVAYQKIIGSPQKIVKNNIFNIQDISFIIDNYVLSATVKVLSMQEVSYTHTERKRISNDYHYKKEEDYITMYNATSPEIYFLQYGFNKNKPLPYSTIKILQEYNNIFGDIFTMPINDDRKVMINNIDHRWRRYDNGYIKCQHDYLGDSDWLINIIIFNTHEINVKTTETYIGNITGQQKQELMKTRSYYTNCSYDNHKKFDAQKERLKDTAHFKEIVKFINSKNSNNDLYDY